jgi:purine-binding chemotaxis protein CheW
MKMNGETTLSTIPRPDRPLPLSRKADGSQVDWEAIRRKVLESSARLTWVDNEPKDILEQTWARRALQIAQEIEAGETGEQIEIVVIRLGREVYGLEAGYVFDIRPLGNLTRVPRVPDWVAGVVNLRGRIISVLDLQRFFNLPHHAALAEDDRKATPHLLYLVVIETPDMEIALLADDILGVESISDNQVKDPANAVRGIPADYVKNEDNPDENTPSLVVILDIKTLLTDKRLIIHEELV